MRIAVSMAIGSPSAWRTRRRWTTGWRDGMPRSLDSDGDDGRMTRVRKRELGTRPCRRISWLNVMSRFVRR